MSLERRTPLRRTPITRGSKPLPAQSAKRKAIAAERREFVNEILAARPRCEFAIRIGRGPGRMISVGDQRIAWVPCYGGYGDEPGPATDVHEIIPRGRGGSIVPSQGLTHAGVAALCRTHHGWIHDHPKAATLLGFLARDEQLPSP